MKKIALIVLTFLLISTSFGQTVTFKELLNKSNCKTFDCFNDFIITKGFSLLNSDETSYLYTSDKSFPTSSTKEMTTKNTAIILFSSNGLVTTGTRTAVNTYYQSLLTQIKASGFTSIETKNIENGVVVYYKSKSYPKVQVAIQTDKLSKDGVGWTSYDISIARLP